MRWAVTILVGTAYLVSGVSSVKKLEPFLAEYCLDCHDRESKKAGLNLEGLGWDITLGNAAKWRKVFEMIDQGDMPPRKKSQPSTIERKAAVNDLLRPLIIHLEAKQESQTVLRRLNRLEYRNTIGDLMGLAVSLWNPAESFPEDETEHGFNNIGEVLITSKSLLEQQLAAATQIVDRAVQFGPRPQVIRFAAKPPTPHYKQTAMTRHTWEVRTQDYISIFTRILQTF